jgi:hypothetical protein
VITYRYSTIIYWTKFPWVSHLKKKEAIFTFRTAFPYLLLWNFSDGTGWEILHGTWNVWHKNWGYRVSVSSLYISPLWWVGGVVCYKGFAPHRFEVFRCLTWLYHINLVCGFFIIIIFIQYTNTIPVGGWVSPGVVSAGVGNRGVHRIGLDVYNPTIA